MDLDLDVDVDLDYPVRRELPQARRISSEIRFLPAAAAIAETLPPRYATMALQLRRAPLSIPLNIAEGSGESTGPDQRRFYAMSCESAMEYAAIIDACHALSLVDQSRAQEADQSTSRSTFRSTSR